jgi:hypothetical protein
MFGELEHRPRAELVEGQRAALLAVEGLLSLERRSLTQRRRDGEEEEEKNTLTANHANLRE